MTDPHLDMSDVRTAAVALGKKRREARRDYERYCEQSADADRDYRKKLAQAYATARTKEMTSAGAELEANAAASDLKHRRDIAQSLAKSSLLRIEELEADRAMLRMIGQWSQSLETVG